MSDVKWTKAQQKAISMRNSGIVVSAAAGSGKTSVLIERLSQLLLDENNKIPAQNLLAVTFTNKAATQMRAKLNSAIDKELVKCFSSPGMRDSEKSSWLLEQKNALQFAKVSTINAFCLEFVKDNISSFEFQSGLKILDEATESMLFDKACKQALEEMCSSVESDYSLICNSFNDLHGILRKVYVFIRTIPFREQWLEQAMAQYTDPSLINEAVENYRGSILDKIRSARQKLNALEVLQSKIASYTQVPKFLASISDASSVLDVQINDIEKSFLSEDLEQYLLSVVARVRKPVFRTNKVINAMADGERAVLCDMCIEAGNTVAAINGIFSDLKKQGVLSQKRIRDNLSQSAELFGLIIKLVQRIEQIVYEAKLERNAVDFSDVEMMTKDLLVEYKDGRISRTQLCEDIRKSGIYKIITIDEFQDVNNLQELIFRALSDGDDLEHIGANAFVVGDIKQAIYRFRQTNPALFSKTVEDANKGFDDLNSVILQENFRSRQGIIEFVNSVFSEIMSEKMGGVDYDSSQELNFGAVDYPSVNEGDNADCVELMLIDRHNDFSASAYSEEFYLVAQRIRRILDKNSGYTVMDNETKKMRQCRPSDICILLQTNDGVSQMAKALEEVGLKAFSQESEGYLKASEITLALSILRVIDNPLNDIAMASMLMSPIFGFTATEMLMIHNKRKRKEGKGYNGIYTVLSNAHLSHTNKNASDFEYERVFDDNKDLQAKCSNTFKMIENFTYRAMSTNLEKLIRYIFDTTGILGITSVYLDSSKKRANLLLFLQYAREYENSGNEGVSGFLRYIDSVYDNNKAFKQAGMVTASGECVNVMTFHASKGLEFPYVFLCDLIHRKKKESDGIYMHYKVTNSADDKNCFAFDFEDKQHGMIKTNVLYSALSGQNITEERSEQMRLFYVGCTRAKEKLFISVSPECNGKISAQRGKLNLENTLVRAQKCVDRQELIEYISSCDNMLYWLMCALSFANLGKGFADWLRDDSDEKKKDSIVDKDKLDEIVSAFGKPPLKAVIKRLADEPITEAIKEKTHHKTFDPELITRLRDTYARESERLENSLDKALLPSKLTVTEIVQREHEKELLLAEQDPEQLTDFNPEFFPSLPKLDENNSKLTPAEKGTFTHKFMELADYSLAELSVKNELERLVRQGYFTPKEASGVYVDRLTAFFESAFYNRMRNSSELLREKKFLVAMKDICVDEKYKGITGSNGMIQGVADCVFKETDGYVIVDYKTDNFKSEQDMDKYGTQLEFYKAALEIVLGRELLDGSFEKARIKSCYIYSFKLGKGKEFVF